ncbi:alcohol dehydrogenase family protein [Microbulbifer sp. SAOS-129_SWC]|uniref:alcohol dehydrogenase family protein n=1 Tax=Microbulbifer sp. SAOS-129_SWC TaxID=3145235 RepID=UPI003216DB4D
MTSPWDSRPRNDRFDAEAGEPAMQAVVTAGNGDYDVLECREVKRPTPGEGEVLLQVLAAGVNNTDINTRVGWYSSSVTTGTDATSTSGQMADGGWNEETPFPFIQGTDCCGRIVAAGRNVDPGNIGARVLVRSCMRKAGFQSMDSIWMGSDFDGAFAQFVTVPASEVFPIHCDWTDAELATIPCAYATAENMLYRSGLARGEHVLIMGASGGVGSAAVQLAKLRGATVTAVASAAKSQQVLAIGADRVIDRNEKLPQHLGEESVDVVVDNVAGNTFPDMLAVLKRGGRYVSSGAIGGPMVSLDMRTLYLKDITLIGCTTWDEPVFPNLITYIENGQLKPLVAKVFPLEQIAAAQREFLQKKHVGNFVLIPPSE